MSPGDEAYLIAVPRTTSSAKGPHPRHGDTTPAKRAMGRPSTEWTIGVLCADRQRIAYAWGVYGKTTWRRSSPKPDGTPAHHLREA